MRIDVSVKKTFFFVVECKDRDIAVEGETEYTCYHYNKKKLKIKYVRVKKF